MKGNDHSCDALRAQRRPARWGRQPPIIASRRTHVTVFAQRRPARWGRQPALRPGAHGCRGLRSTKAGPVGPATRGTAAMAEPAPHRSTKAGPVGPATPHDSTTCMAATDRRSTKAGPVGPATPDNGRYSVPQFLTRSTKAGPVGPATLDRHVGCPHCADAQRRPARWGRQPRVPSDDAGGGVARSTKAGPVGPATPVPTAVATAFDCLRSTKAGPVGPATPGGHRRHGHPQHLAQRRPARWGRQPWASEGGIVTGV